MKRICITYHMEKYNETAENCVTVYASDQNAAALLNRNHPRHPIAELHAEGLAAELAWLAGYAGGSYIGAEVKGQVEE